MVNEDGSTVSEVEIIKQESQHLRGSIAQELLNGDPFFTESSRQLLKFHGIYQQDDRDLRKQMRKEGKDKYYMMMVRARIPGGNLSADQYLRFAEISDEYGNGTMRITTRQTIQLHGILKENLKQTIGSLNEALVTTLNGCGDQARNSTTCAAPIHDSLHQEIHEDLQAIVVRVGAKTNAYHEIWLDGEQIQFDQKEEEPLYKEAYLPRKFKFCIGIEGDNCLDVYSNDTAFIAHQENGHVVGYTVLSGGSMGRSASIKTTYARLASPIAYIPRADIVDVAVAILTVFRDFGNREDRRYARLKYLLDSKGIEWFRKEVENRIGYELADPRTLTWHSADDHLGWHEQGDGQWFFGLFIENGRIQDTDEFKLKTVLKEIVQKWNPSVTLTTQQNIILSGFTQANRPELEALLRAAHVKTPSDLSKTLLNSMACVGLPTCPLAVADSERVLPVLIPKFEQLVKELGIDGEDISIRMTGCANGCSRPYIANIAFVGRAPGKYDVFIGGDSIGTRLNQLFKEIVPTDKLVAEVTPVLTAFAKERTHGEEFGEYCERVGLSRFHSELLAK